MIWALQHCSSVEAFGFGHVEPGANAWYYDAATACPAERESRGLWQVENERGSGGEVRRQATVSASYAHDLVFEQRLVQDLHDYGVIRKW